ncbi:uncharacterized protein DUF4340 [Stella humosa]|uniref:Uncharacterized protein DUF4340 n=1 Tax=Stella humosa TaxID=94 RepID=A0A3N1KYY6_9PROT|nr:DUF4340 domain-containing protein [Stella humosa]ROP84377.1 uncharacterized protein DUF4340 [Stella humosa]BBK33893.1 hypothetical protein STHU_45270 [Stella humosa]
MRKTTFMVLVGAAIVASAGAVYLSVGGRDAPITARAGEIFLPELQRRANDARELVLTRSSGTATFKQQGDRWIYVEKGDFPANGEQIRRVLVELAELRLVESKTRKPDLYPRLQVEDATGNDARSTLMTVKDGQGAVIADVIVGRRRIDRLGGGRDSLYVRRKGSDQAWLAAGNVDVTGDYPRFLVRALVDIKAERIAEVTTIQPDGSRLVIRRDKPADEMVAIDLPEGKAVKEKDKVTKAATALAGLDLDDVRKRGEADIPDNATKAEIRTFDGLLVTVATHETNYRAWSRFTVEAAADASEEVRKEAAALKARLEPYDFEMLGYKTAPFTTKLVDLTGES